MHSFWYLSLSPNLLISTTTILMAPAPILVIYVLPWPAPISTTYSQARINAIILTVLGLLTALPYSFALFLTYRSAKRNPKAFDTRVGARIQRYTPAAYVLLLAASLSETGLVIWLLEQYHAEGNLPNPKMHIGLSLVLFSSIWTCLTGGALLLMFVHPRWSQHPAASIGTQSIWLLVTWVFWTAGSGVVNSAVPLLTISSTCTHVVYCQHVRGVFALAIIVIALLIAGMCMMIWLAGRLARIPSQMKS
ncbi:hypothetical protein BD410DRAFT_606650 [Rickenella mellea]|uniref:MARVEL domain-containing protein n=1 Tax=Rickenella mellea TaxID=50990 RepID=A0A4Y7QFV2_9AGAM|nr:hypothetical protein BD410DRAFT_606650 [Rickenella mellea]